MAISFQDKIKFQNKPETRLDEFDFIGGLVTDVHETKLEPNQSPNIENVAFNETGSIKTRPGYARYNADPIGISSDVSETGASAGTLAIDAAGDYVAQTFIPSGDINVVQVDMYLALADVSNQQHVRVELQSTSAGAPDLVLTNGQSQIKLVTDASETEYSFRFREPVALSASTTYAIVIKPYIQGSTNTVNQVDVHHRGATYANGNAYTSIDSGINWTSDTAKDLKFNVFSGGDTGGTGLIRYYGPSALKQLIAKIGTSLYVGDDGAGTLTAQTLGSGGSLIAANYIDYTIFDETLLVVDAQSKIQKYRGSTNSNYTTGTISVTVDDATVTGSGTSWSTTTNAEVGEYIQLPDTKWYKIISIASDTSLEVETDYKGSTQSGQSYKISPWGEVQGQLNTATVPASLVRPTPKYIESHRDRVWTLDGNELRFSVLDTSVDEECFNDWDTANNSGAIIIPSGKGGKGTGLYSLNNVLYIFQRRAIWGLYGNSPANFELRNITNEIGMLDKRTLVEWNDILLFLSDKGVYMFDGSNLKNITDGIVNKSIDAWANKTSPAAVLWKNTYVISYSPTGDSYNRESLAFDLTRQAWSKYTRTYVGAWSSWAGGTDAGEIYFISSNQGTIYQWDTGTNDDNYETKTVYDTPSLGFDANVNDKTIKRFYIQQLVQGDYSMQTTMFSDISATTSGGDVSLAPGTVSLWDTAVWDTDVWSGEGDILTNRIAEFQGIAKYYKFRLEIEGLNESIDALGITVTERTRRLT